MSFLYIDRNTILELIEKCYFSRSLAPSTPKIGLFCNFPPSRRLESHIVPFWRFPHWLYPVRWGEKARHSSWNDLKNNLFCPASRRALDFSFRWLEHGWKNSKKIMKQKRLKWWWCKFELEYSKPAKLNCGRNIASNFILTSNNFLKDDGNTS